MSEAQWEHVVDAAHWVYQAEGQRCSITVFYRHEPSVAGWFYDWKVACKVPFAIIGQGMATTFDRAQKAALGVMHELIGE